MHDPRVLLVGAWAWVSGFPVELVVKMFVVPFGCAIWLCHLVVP